MSAAATPADLAHVINMLRGLAAKPEATSEWIGMLGRVEGLLHAAYRRTQEPLPGGLTDSAMVDGGISVLEYVATHLPEPGTNHEMRLILMGGAPPEEGAEAAIRWNLQAQARMRVRYAVEIVRACREATS